MTLMSVHNIWYYMRLMERLRAAICAGRSRAVIEEIRGLS